jgi:hypothetical protein
MKKVQNLRYIVDEHRVHVDSTNIQVNIDWPSPKTLNKLRSFLGLANFYRSFVFGLFHIAWALSQVNKGGYKSKFVWGRSQLKSFDDLKHRLCSLVLSLLDMQQPFEIETDASNYVAGVVFSQHSHPVAYNSEALSYAIRKYPTYAKEMYSIIQAYFQWKHYILEKETIIHTDHMPLQFMHIQDKFHNVYHQKLSTCL